MQAVKKILILAALLMLPLSAPASAAPLVNMSVVNTDVRDVLTALASVGGVSIIADDSASGKITIQLKNVPFYTALELVTRTKGLVYQRVGHVIVIAAPDKLSKGFGSVQIIKIVYAKAADIKKSLAAIIPEDRLKVDEASNCIVFTGSPAEAEDIRRALTELDIPYRQISLEAQVVAITKTATKDLGFDWKWSGIPAKTEYDTSGSSTTVTREYPGVISFGRNPEGKRYEMTFQATLSALVTKGDAQILARPNVTTLDGKEANILIGDRIPVLIDKTQNGVTTTTIEYVDAGIKLKYTPRINGDGQITANVHTEVSTPTLVTEMKAYRITTREAETSVRMQDGETMVIGGLIGNEESGGKNKVPILADLPILGKLFQSVHNTKTQNEIVIFLTARIVK
jgi:type II secretory pathway component GspD/PulD (secretin)